MPNPMNTKLKQAEEYRSFTVPLHRRGNHTFPSDIAWRDRMLSVKTLQPVQDQSDHLKQNNTGPPPWGLYKRQLRIKKLTILYLTISGSTGTGRTVKKSIRGSMYTALILVASARPKKKPVPTSPYSSGHSKTWGCNKSWQKGKN